MNAALQLPPEPGKAASAVLAVLVHIVLALLLVYGVRWQTRPPEAVEVELVRVQPAPVAPPAAEAAPPKAEPQPLAKVEPQPQEKAAPPKPDIAFKEKRKKPEPAPQPARKAEPRKPEPDKASRQLLAEALRREQQQLEARKAEEELARIRAAQAEAARNRARNDYIAKIRQKIKGNIVLPPDIKGNPEAIFDVVQLPSGEILSVRLKKSSGHAAYDRAVERAILKSSPLPRPEQPDLFSRSLELKFRPLEE